MTTFCWLPPESDSTGTLTCGALMERLFQYFRTAASSASWSMRMNPEKRSRLGRLMFCEDGLDQHQAHPLAVLGHQADAVRHGLPGALDG